MKISWRLFLALAVFAMSLAGGKLSTTVQASPLAGAEKEVFCSISAELSELDTRVLAQNFYVRQAAAFSTPEEAVAWLDDQYKNNLSIPAEYKINADGGVVLVASSWQEWWLIATDFLGPPPEGAIPIISLFGYGVFLWRGGQSLCGYSEIWIPQGVAIKLNPPGNYWSLISGGGLRPIP